MKSLRSENAASSSLNLRCLAAPQGNNMLREEMKRLSAEFGFLSEDIGIDISNQIKQAGKLDSVDTVTFGLETDDGKIIKVFVNAKDAEKFEALMADCLGSTDSIEEAINKAATEVDIVDVEWPKDDDDGAEEEAPQGSEAMDQKVYGNDKEKDDKKTIAKKDVSMEAIDDKLSRGEKLAIMLNEDHGAVSSRMTTPNQQLIYQAVLDLGIPEQALDRSAYRAAIIKGMRLAAIELQSNGSAKTALKTFVKKRIEDDKHKGREEKKEDVKESSSSDIAAVYLDKAIQTTSEKKAGLKEAVIDKEVILKTDKDGMLLSNNGMSISLNLEELERVLKALAEKSTTVIGKITVSARTSSMMLKMRGAPAKLELNAPKVAEFKELAAKLLG
jgi:hypothetical protein